MKRAALILPVLLASLARCGGAAQTTSGGASADAGPDASPTPVYDPDAGWSSSDDASGTTKTDACSSAALEGGDTDPPDPLGLDTNCDGADGVLGRDVYVSVQLGADTNPGTPKAPLQTVAAALTRAATTGGSVLLLNGTYPVTSLADDGTWAIYGGYPTGFLGKPNRQTTVLTAPDTGLFVSGATSATLAHLTVEGDMPSVLSQPTAYGLRTNATALHLLDVIVQSGDGLPMTPALGGATGTAGVSDEGPLTCNGVAQPAYTSGSCCGESSVEGKLPGSILWGLRSQGTAGNPGTDGNDATGTVSITNNLLVGDVGRPGQANGTPGYGASVGGAPPANWTPPTGVAAGSFSGGNGGSGGCPGVGGAGGATGGGSVAVLVLAGTVLIEGSTLEAGLGGDGGDGGQGGAGGPGGQGTAPYYAGPAPLTYPAVCTPATDPLGVNCAEYGGIGGTGGTGGHGGGGAGGSTFGVVTVGAAAATLDAASTVTLGEPGSGGAGNGGGRAPNGKRTESFHID